MNIEDIRGISCVDECTSQASPQAIFDPVAFFPTINFKLCKHLVCIYVIVISYQSNVR